MRFFLIILAVVIIAILGAFYFDAPVESPINGKIGNELSGPVVPRETSRAIITDGEPTGARVEYIGGKFVPTHIKLVQSSSGCFISVANESSASLVLRLSPHSLRDDIGVLYSEVKPGEAMLLDPRFRVEKIAFHNHKNPIEEFSVELGEGCREF